MRGRYSSRIPF